MPRKKPGKDQEKPGNISGSVLDPEQKGIEAATVQLLRAKDQGLVKFAVTNGQGSFELEKIAEGKYIISITAIGFEKRAVKLSRSPQPNLWCSCLHCSWKKPLSRWGK